MLVNALRINPSMQFKKIAPHILDYNMQDIDSKQNDKELVSGEKEAHYLLKSEKIVAVILDEFTNYLWIAIELPGRKNYCLEVYSLSSFKAKNYEPVASWDKKALKYKEDITNLEISHKWRQLIVIGDTYVAFLDISNNQK